MAFKTIANYNEEKFGGLFMLRNDGDSADVVFLYRNTNDVLVADTHYIKSADYSGYVHCLGKGCPACAKGIRTQTKLFIPMYNVTTQQIEFWDRTMRFENQLDTDVFSKYPNPSEFVFRIRRSGVPGDVNTTYSIVAVGRNTLGTYDELLSRFNVTMLEHYETICKSMSRSQLLDCLSGGNNDVPDTASTIPAYIPTPRVTPPAAPAPDAANVSISAPTSFSAPTIDDSDISDTDMPDEVPF